MFKVSCTSKSGDGGGKLLFDRVFNGETPGQAVKHAKDYAKKKGIEARKCEFKAVEQNVPRRSGAAHLQ